MLKVLLEVHLLIGLSDGSWLRAQIGCLKSSGWKPLPGAVDTAVNDLTNLWSVPQLSRNTVINLKRPIEFCFVFFVFFLMLGFSFVKDVLGTVEPF